LELGPFHVDLHELGPEAVRERVVKSLDADLDLLRSNADWHLALPKAAVRRPVRHMYEGRLPGSSLKAASHFDGREVASERRREVGKRFVCEGASRPARAAPSLAADRLDEPPHRCSGPSETT
jgi:hypothetical protein